MEIKFILYIQDEIETIITSQSNEYLSKKISKRLSYSLSIKTSSNFSLIILQFLFQRNVFI